jgi:hypothetical protein
MCLPDVAHILPKNPRSDNSSFRMRLGDLIAIIGRQLHTFWAVIEIALRALRELRRLGSADDARAEARGDAAETAAKMCRKRRGSAVLAASGLNRHRAHGQQVLCTECVAWLARAADQYRADDHTWDLDLALVLAFNQRLGRSLNVHTHVQTPGPKGIEREADQFVNHAVLAVQQGEREGSFCSSMAARLSVACCVPLATSCPVRGRAIYVVCAGRQVSVSLLLECKH